MERRRQRRNLASSLLYLAFSTVGAQHTTECNGADTSCNFRKWTNWIKAANGQRLQTQRASRIFAQLAIGYDRESGAALLQSALANASLLLGLCMRGSAADGIPAPLSNNISNTLIHVSTDFENFQNDISRLLSSNDFSNSALRSVVASSKTVIRGMEHVAESTVVLAVRSGIPADIVSQEILRRQAIEVEIMIGEALQVVLGDSELGAGELSSTFKRFESSHDEVLVGREKTQPIESMSDIEMRRVENACVLDGMMHVLHHFKSMRKILETAHEIRALSNGTREVVFARQVSELGRQTIGALSVAADYLEDEKENCAVQRSIQVWEANLNEMLQVPGVLEKTVSEYYLLASNLSQTWIARSAETLKEHQGYILQEARTEMVVDAIKGFSSGWNSFRETDALREVGLQVAYITSNPAPTGSKDTLDFAPGEEEYHRVHKNFHPIYRDILYDRNYYDIFMLDMAGNLVYSVYKELDYATNFAKSGEGKWKDSGLGEAFEAAKSEPDKIHVIDWKPYGPSFGALASFLSTGVRDNTGKVIGVFSTQLPPESVPLNSFQRLEVSKKKMDRLLETSIFGVFDVIGTPPTQEVANSLFRVNDLWNNLTTLVEGAPDTKGASSVNQQIGEMTNTATELVDLIKQEAKSAQPTLKVDQLDVCWKQVYLVERMSREAVGVELSLSTRNDIMETMTQYEGYRRLMLDGLISDEESSTGIPIITDRELLDKITPTAEVWQPLKDLLLKIVSGDETTEPLMRAVTDFSDSLSETTTEIANYVGTTTRTTTRIAIELLVPIPITGVWSGGRTMRVASLVAQSVINDDGIILPGYDFRSVFFDDGCDGASSSKIITEEVARTNNSYIGLGGGGCNAVCSQSAPVAANLSLPYVSYGCNSRELTDEIAYPDFSQLGTVIETGDIIKKIGSKLSWKHINLISGVQPADLDKVKNLGANLERHGFSVTNYSAAESSWDDTLEMMRKLKENSIGQDRIVFFVGTERFYREVICAAIVTGNRKGITWISEGSWREDWWTRSEEQTDFHVQWLKEDVAGRTLKNTFDEFKRAWNEFRPSAEETRAELQILYQTDQKEKLEFPAGAGRETYHRVHKSRHSTWRKVMEDRGYYDIFIFDLNGDMIYSVYKESDYATNFAKEGDGMWKSSGLGDAFERAKAEPDEVHYIDWSPYGPSGGVDAAFFSTGLRDSAGNLVGVYSIQLPPDFKRSITDMVAQCPVEAISEHYDGAINVVGIGKQLEKNHDERLQCFGTHTFGSFSALLDTHMRDGYPSGDSKTAVAAPYAEEAMSAADGVCIFAFTVRKLLDEGYSIEQIRDQDENVYRRFVKIIKNETDFLGMSGRVKFDGNERNNPLVVHQIVQSRRNEIGIVHLTGDIDWSSGYPLTSMWAKGEQQLAKSKFPWHYFQIIIPTYFIVMPALAGAVRGFFGSR